MVRVLLLEVGNEEDHCKYDTESSYNDVADCQEVVLASKSISGREDKALFAIERRDIIGICDVHSICSWCEGSVYLTPEFPEIRKTSSSHPNDKVLYKVHE